MKKKYLVTTIAMLATVSMLAACSDESVAEDNKTTPAPTVTVAPTEEATPTPGDRGDGPVKPTEAPSNTPDETAAHNQMLQNVAQALKETYGMLYAPDMQMQNDEFYMKDTLGLEASWYDAAYVEVPGMSFGADKLIMIHPTEGNLENVQKALNTFRDNQIADTFQYPSTLPQRQAALVETIGEYVCYMIFTGSVGDVMFEDEAVAIQAYTEANQMAREIIAAVISGEMVVEPWTEFDKMRNEIVKWYGTTYYPNVKVHEDEAYLGTYLADTLKIDAAWVDEIIIEVPMISANADTLILVDPSEGNAENVLKALQDYKTYLVEESFQYPMNEARVKTAAVAQVGDYVCFSILGGAVDNPEEMGITNDEELAGYYESMNMNAIYALQSYLGIFE
ncbi:MAG: DUF4358 domain-containing protein [Lachnospiraceae bacterium]|nr:DUF4358 domain-containing protein [Lachnospiraceae bacterium]